MSVQTSSIGIFTSSSSTGMDGIDWMIEVSAGLSLLNSSSKFSFHRTSTSLSFDKQVQFLMMKFDVKYFESNLYICLCSALFAQCAETCHFKRWFIVAC